MSDTTKSDEEPLWVREARARIERQSAIVSALEAGTEEHDRAVRALAILEKSLVAMIDAEAIIAALQKKRLQPSDDDDGGAS